MNVRSLRVKGHLSTFRPSLWQFAALVVVVVWLVIAVPLFWAEDATGYLAAGERLNAGHALYALSPGDRLVSIQPPFFSSPFLYPPIWGEVWRPLAALPGGLWLWMVAVSGAMLAWLLRTLPANAGAMSLLAAPFAVMLASGNVGGLILVGMAATRSAGDRRAGLIVGAMAAVKLTPAVLIVWLLATRRWRAVAWAVATAGLLTLAGVLLAGPDATVQYLRVVVPSTNPMGISPAYLLGAPWITYAIIAAGVVMIALRRSFAAAVATAVFGSPAVGVASLALLGAALREDVAVAGVPLSSRPSSTAHATPI